MAIDTTNPGTPRQWLLLAALVVVLAAILVYRFGGGAGGSPPAGGAGPTSNTPGRVTGAPGAATPEALDVRLDQLQATPERPAEIERNPFRFEARRRPEDPGGASRPAPPPELEPEPAQPSGPAALPPIPLKFIGIIESPQAGRVAALSDGRRVFQGRVGDIIEGRYRIVRIGAESIVLEPADGSGPQQTIRLSGQ